MPGGRPTKYRPEMCERLVELMGQGLDKTAACVELGIRTETLYQWAKQKPEFSDAVKAGEEACSRWWQRVGRDAALGGVENFNATAFVWMTKNVLKWTDRQDVTSGDEKVSVTVNLHGRGQED